MKKAFPYFSLAFYRDTLVRIRTFSIIIAVIFTVLPTVESASYLISQITASMSGLKIESVALSLIDINGTAANFVTVIVPIMAIVAFSFLMKRNESDFYESLPFTRCEIAISGMLAVFTSAVFILLISSLVPIFVLVPCMGRSVDVVWWKSAVEFLGLMLASALAISGAMIAVAVTGTVRNAVLTAALILGAPRIIMALINYSLEFLNPSLVSGHIIPIFDNNYNIFTSVFSSNVSALTNPWSYLYTAILFIAYTVVAVKLFERRKSEYATHSFANTFARHSVRITLATLFSMLGIFLLSIELDLLFVSVILFIWSVAVYFIYELITGRKENTFVSSLVTFPIFIAVNVLLAVFIIVSNIFFTAYSPDSEEIESVSIVSEPGELMYMDYAEYVTVRSSNLSLSDDESRDVVAKALDRSTEGSPGRDYRSVVFKIKTSRGTAYRKLFVSNDELKTMNHLLAEQTEYEALWLNVAEGAMNPNIYTSGVNLNSDASMRILKEAEREVKELGFVRWYEIYTSDETFGFINYRAEYSGEYYEISLPIFVSMTKTVELYERERENAAQATIEAIKTRLSDALSGDRESVWLDVTYFSKEFFIVIEEQISPSNEKAEGLVAELIPLLSSDSLDYDSMHVSISLYSEELFSESIYVDLAVTDGISEESLIEFFKKYGNEY